MSLAAWYQSKVACYGDSFLFDSSLTFAETYRLANERAVFLKQQGVRVRDCVAILATNSPGWCISYMAITLMGATAVPLDTNLTQAQYQRMLQIVKAKAVFISDQFSFMELGVPLYQIAPEQSCLAGDPCGGGDDDGIASLIFTSGTTGEPKVVALTQANLMQTIEQTVQHFKIDKQYTFMGVLPLYHIYGFLVEYLAPLCTGGRVIFVQSLKGPDILAALKKYPIHIFPGVPQLWELFLEGMFTTLRNKSKLLAKIIEGSIERPLPVLTNILTYPLRKVFGKEFYFIISGGAALRPETFRKLRAIGLRIVEGYGLTETTGPVCGSKIEGIKPGCVGQPIPGNELQLRQTKDGIGEIWIKGVSVMAGYYENPTATKEVIRDGWFNTGDVGYLDSDGELHITGRTKNIIVLDSGKNVYPEEVEQWYMYSPLIKELVVFGRKSGTTEKVYAVIVPQRGSYAEIKDDIDRLSAELPSYKRIEEFALSAEPLPRNTIKKVIVREVVKRLDAGEYQCNGSHERSAFVPRTEQQQKITEYLLERCKCKNFFNDQTFQESAVDSLKYIDLVAGIEQLAGISINLAAAPRERIADFIRYCDLCPKAEHSVVNDLLSGPLTYKAAIIPNPIVDVLRWAVLGLSWLFWGLRIEHRERLYQKNVIFAPNHQSYLDIVWFLAALPASIRRNTFMLGKKEVGFLSWIFPGLPVIYVERGGEISVALKASADVLRQGRNIIIFPEGTRTHTGKIGEFKTGVAYLSTHLQKPIVPITISGAFDIYPRQNKLPKLFTKVHGKITVHEKLEPGTLSVGELNRELFARISAIVTA
jgi:long-chain acyl-CoA synthetase